MKITEYFGSDWGATTDPDIQRGAGKLRPTFHVGNSRSKQKPRAVDAGPQVPTKVRMPTFKFQEKDGD